MSGRLRAFARQHQHQVLAAYVDADGTVWIELKPGWTANPRDAHDIAEGTVAEALAKAARIQPCACADCTQARPADCGRPHPQPYCTCRACEVAR